jgi:cytochrome c biogenesis protein CcmG, thiol:disulfide interchange protein DsbE
MPRKGERPVICSLALSLACLAMVTACGSENGGDGSPPPDYEQALEGAPKPLAALHAQANELLGGGTEAFQKRIAELRGYPVVVNQWASWCGPCRLEFPYFQRLSARYGKRVAFLGVDSQDSDDAAKTFLEEEPVPYPSYTDPDKQIGEILEATRGLPDTSFYSREGQLLYTKQGPYTSQEELEADIQAYALRPASGGG